MAAQTRDARSTEDSPRSSHVPQRSNEIAGAPPADAVAVRAYELFEERGRQSGHDVDDWLRAEHELEDTRGKGE
jgi:hypothetical protein